MSENNYEDVLAGQIPEYTGDEQPAVFTGRAVVNEQPNNLEQNNLYMQSPVSVEEPIETVVPQVQQTSNIGKKINIIPGKTPNVYKESAKELKESAGMSKIGESIHKTAEIRDGWMDVDKSLLGERAIFYPEDWQFRVRPATVEAIRNWSTIDDENPLSVDSVFNEIVKSCVSIIDGAGRPITWGNINAWDRFFFILLVRNYTFINGEAKIEFTEDCHECDNPVKFELNSTTLVYDMPDPEVMPAYSKDERTWLIDPAEYGVEGYDPIILYLPTLEKDQNIREWFVDRARNNKKVDEVFVRFLPWIVPKIAKDLSVAQRQIRSAEVVFKSWDVEMFSFMDSVIKNIVVTPLTKLTTICPVCGEEVTSTVQFPNGPSGLFSTAHKHTRFGKK